MRTIFLICLTTLVLHGCGQFKMPGVHRIPVQQGNYLEYKDVEQVQVGMSKADVKAILGTPVVGSLFNQSRWEYIYKLRTEQYGLFENLYTVYFEDDIVSRIESDIEKPPEEPKEEIQEELIEAEVNEELDDEMEALEKAEEVLEQADN